MIFKDLYNFYFIEKVCLHIIKTYRFNFYIICPKQNWSRNWLQVKMMKFYPNLLPRLSISEFQRNFDKSYSLQIFNFMGKKVYELKTLSPCININLDEFYRGIYIFQLRDKTVLS